jgi:hypothetical protein
VGDVIIGVRGQKVDEAPDVLAAVSCLGKGQRATIELVRDGRSRTLEATARLWRLDEAAGSRRRAQLAPQAARSARGEGRGAALFATVILPSPTSR